mgnify:FL=1
MNDILRPIIVLSAIIPATILAYLPIKNHLKTSKLKLFGILIPSLVGLCILCGLICCYFKLNLIFPVIPITIILTAIYCCTANISVWKSASISLAVFGVFCSLACITRIIDLTTYPQNTSPWFEMNTAILYIILSWLFVLIVWYPATHGVSRLLDDENLAQTWYVFWILPITFTLINLFIVPWNTANTLEDKSIQIYIVVSTALFILLLIFYALLYFIAKSLNHNNRLIQENQFLNMQQAQYDTIKGAIEETRQARHDMRHHFAVLNALAEQKDWKKLEDYLSSASQSIPDTELQLCKNGAVNGIVGHYYARCKNNDITLNHSLDLPENLPVIETDICLVIANLLENALEASLKSGKTKKQISITAYLHSDNIIILSVENDYNGEINEKGGIFSSSKRNGYGIGTQSVRRIAEKNGGYCKFTYNGGTFRADVMLRG